jgi:hypothetical protein
MWCLIPQPFTAGGNRLYPDFWVVTSDPWYPGYKTPTSFVITIVFIKCCLYVLKITVTYDMTKCSFYFRMDEIYICNDAVMI